MAFFFVSEDHEIKELLQFLKNFFLAIYCYGGRATSRDHASHSSNVMSQTDAPDAWCDWCPRPASVAGVGIFLNRGTSKRGKKVFSFLMFLTEWRHQAARFVDATSKQCKINKGESKRCLLHVLPGCPPQRSHLTYCCAILLPVAIGYK